MDIEELKLLNAVAEMELQRYVVDVDDYDAVDNLYLLSWQDSEGMDWSFWATPDFINELFDELTLN